MYMKCAVLGSGLSEGPIVIRGSLHPSVSVFITYGCTYVLSVSMFPKREYT